MQIEEHLSRLDALLEPWRARLDADHVAYRNHCRRMLAFSFALHPPSDEEREKCVIAACFHDLGLWTDDTLDYLPPSVRLARAYLAAAGLSAWSEEIAAMIDDHHKLRASTSPWPLVEIFRRADLVDFSLGLVRFGLPADFVREVKSRIPNAGFHARLVRLTLRQLVRDPLHLLPMMKW